MELFPFLASFILKCLALNWQDMTGSVDSVIFKGEQFCPPLLSTELLIIDQLAAGHVETIPTALLAGWFVGDTKRSVDGCCWDEEMQVAVRKDLCRTAGIGLSKILRTFGAQTQI